ncbi:MAG TPA: hypothetical protein VLK28_02770 [Methylomirabilota bacterium]|nr:hypothetical protein [Methylomirabilota bacterium]
MKIAFLASRKGYLKVMGSLIQASLDRGHEAILLTDPGERKPGEAATPADVGQWPAARVLARRPGEPLLPLARERGVDALVGPSLHFVLTSMGPGADLAGLRAAAVRLYSVDYVLETLTSDPEAYRLIDVTFYATEFERRLHWDLHKERFAAIARDVSLEARSAVSGSTMLDQLTLVDRDAVRRRLRIAPGRPVVLLMSLKMAVPEPFRRYVWADGPALIRAAMATASGHVRLVPAICKGNGYRDLVEAAREFCRRSGASLIVKSREKNRDPRFLRGAADVLVEADEAVYPYTSIELMAIADLCVHFQSGAVLEASAASVPSISVRVPQTHLHDYPGHEEVFGGRAGTLQNFAGVVWSVGHAEAPGLLAGRTLADFKIDAEARRRYLERFVGADDGRSSQRVLDVIERRR